ncbi:GNAT family N-acetyltransferase [Neisseria chenwenguii]|nr:GNAT family N-acetyltransferase [Neisseria chenwenguii]
MNWHNKPFDSLSVCELFEIYKARMAVFVVEQNCAYPEVDDKDLNARHFFAESGGRIAACCRIIPENGAVRVGRVLVAQTARGGGSGRDLMRRALEFARAEYKGWPVLLQARFICAIFTLLWGLRRCRANIWKTAFRILIWRWCRLKKQYSEIKLRWLRPGSKGTIH